MKVKDVIEIFKKDVRDKFDFSQAPGLIRNRNVLVLSGSDMAGWATAQASFLKWTRSKRVFSEEYVKLGQESYNAFFLKRGPLQGNVLDIGGGWGLYRQWWEPTESDIFIVHDPGVDRFLQGAHQHHYYYYKKAFSRPMTFVEGFGEDLPYHDEIFDTCLMANALDHCLNPKQVFAQAYRCLKPGGAILIIQHCYSNQSQNQHRPHIIKRIVKHLFRPQNWINIFLNLFIYKDPHLHHFLAADISALLEGVGFKNMRVCVIPGLPDMYAFEAQKRGS